MKVLSESGVLPRSERYFGTPSSLARRLFLYVTRCGHYYCDTRYDFQSLCDIGREESHRNYILFYLRAGAMRFDANGTILHGGRGQCALIDCRFAHRFTATQDTEQLWVHFDGAGAHEFVSEILARSGGRHVFTPSAACRVERELTALIAQMREEHSSSESAQSQRLYGILCDLLCPPLNTDSGDAIAIRYIDAHLFEPLAVEQIAAQVNLSVSHFSRQFRAHTGFSPHEYITLHRIDEAKALLHGTGLNVQQIAYRVGYKSDINFISSFTSKVGMSPTAFRKRAF